MALNTHLSIASWNLGLNAAIDVLNGGFVDLYSGTQPATPPGHGPERQYAPWSRSTLSATAFGAASSATKTANAITSGTAGNTGTATFFRAYKSDHTTAVIDGSVGTSGADMTIATTSIVSGATVSCSSWTVSDPSGQ